jgi:hypothetical protein
VAIPVVVVRGKTVPHVAPAHPAPVTVYVTPLLPVSFVNVAVNVCVPLTVTLAVVGATETVIGGAAVIVTVAEADLVGSATEVAVTVRVAGVGTVAGAV